MFMFVCIMQMFCSWVSNFDNPHQQQRDGERAASGKDAIVPLPDEQKI